LVRIPLKIVCNDIVIDTVRMELENEILSNYSKESIAKGTKIESIHDDAFIPKSAMPGPAEVGFILDIAKEFVIVAGVHY
jgi:hypothetical protein